MHRITIHHSLIASLRTALADADVSYFRVSSANGWTTVEIECDDATAADLAKWWWVETIETGATA
jgi:hypothetical protein